MFQNNPVKILSRQNYPTLLARPEPFSLPFLQHLPPPHPTNTYKRIFRVGFWTIGLETGAAAWQEMYTMIMMIMVIKESTEWIQLCSGHTNTLYRNTVNVDYSPVSLLWPLIFGCALNLFTSLVVGFLFVSNISWSKEWYSLRETDTSPTGMYKKL
jgi:hypothetical protein